MEDFATYFFFAFALAVSFYAYYQGKKNIDSDTKKA